MQVEDSRKEEMAAQQPEAGMAHGGSRASTHGILHNLNSKEEHRRNPSGHLKWDEAAIAAHDKERGTRMKIDEPPTPYHRDHLDYKGVPAAALRESLEKVQVNALGQALTTAEIDMKKKEDFERRRRLHYANEKRGAPEKASDESDNEISLAHSTVASPVRMILVKDTW